MRRYIVLAAALLALTGCGKDTQEPAPTAQVNTEAVTEITTEEIPAEVKPDAADIRTYCVSLDAARNEIITNYKDKIPEKLKETFDANSAVLDEYMDKAAGELTDADAEKLFSALKNLEIFFCQTMAEEIGAGDKIQEVAVSATKGADYYFEKASEEDSEETTAEGETSEDGEKSDDTEKDGEDKESDDAEETETETEEKTDNKTE